MGKEAAKSLGKTKQRMQEEMTGLFIENRGENRFVAFLMTGAWKRGAPACSVFLNGSYVLAEINQKAPPVTKRILEGFFRGEGITCI